MHTFFKGRAYSVGDGFCYEGIIENRDNNYHFVIDCGSQSPYHDEQKKGKLKNTTESTERLQEITDEIKRNGKINLFILTHLHKDHYNGIKYLFDKEMPDTIIMPYLYPEERMCLISDDTYDEYDEFLARPYYEILELAEKRGKTVELILVRGNNYREGRIDSESSSADEITSWGEEYEDEREIISDIEGLGSSRAKVVRAESRGVEIRDHIWKFKFFNIEADKDGVTALREKYGKLTTAELYEIIKTPKKFKELRKRYESFFREKYLNNTSVVVYHAPVDNFKRCGTLITGDISLKHSIADEMLKYYYNELKSIGLFSMPHHGSNENWNTKFIAHNNFNGIVSFASTHNYYSNRLDEAMMVDLRNHDICTLVVDENRFSEFVHYICRDYPINKHTILKCIKIQ